MQLAQSGAWMTRLLNVVLLAVVLCLSAVPASVRAANAQEQLRSFVEQVKSATGSFSQYVIGTKGQTRPPQTGKFSFERPGRFKWDVLQPYAQQIVSDGKEVFQLDPDLNQVTVRQVTKAIGSSPAAILFGSGSLEQNFDVTAMADKDGLAWLRAKPRDGEAGFVYIEIGMGDGLPRRIVLLDAFGQITRVELSGFERNPVLPPATFKFSAPAGVDVVRMQ